jgi:hypothetical protein
LYCPGSGGEEGQWVCLVGAGEYGSTEASPSLVVFRVVLKSGSFYLLLVLF